MCLTPISMYNTAKRFSITGGSSLKQTFACGHCAHCLTRKRDEYSFRTYWHAKECIDNGGYIYFCTLTYDSDNLPRISHFFPTTEYGIDDFSCFNLEHYKLFFKRLRRAIEHKYHIVNAITYFFTTEYGDDDNYTHRPHYHPLIFVKSKLIHPLWLSRTVSKCWQYGRTDGIDKKPLKYVAKHIYGYDLGFGSNSEDYILRAVTHYVSKYITKNIKFESELKKRIQKVYLALGDSIDIKSITKQISMFHRQSQGYGLYFLTRSNFTSDDRIALDNDTGLLPDTYKVTKSVPLPMYYIRKMYYEVVTRSDKTKYWCLTEFGKHHKVERMFVQVEELVKRLNDLYYNVFPQQKSHIDRLLDGRSLFDYSIYKVFYSGRIRHYNSVNLYDNLCQKGLTDNEYLDVWTETIKSSFDSNRYPFTKCYNSYDGNNIYVNNSHYYNDEPYTIYPYKIYTKKEFALNFTFNEKSCYQFRYFDVLSDLFAKLIKDDTKNAQSTFDYLTDFKERIKVYYNVKEN